MKNWIAASSLFILFGCVTVNNFGHADKKTDALKVNVGSVPPPGSTPPQPPIPPAPGPTPACHGFLCKWTCTLPWCH